MTYLKRFHNLPLRLQLMLVLGGLSVITTAVCTATLTHLASERMRATLSERSERIARRLSQQLVPSVAHRDAAIARDLFTGYGGDRDLDGIAVYTDVGDLIEGWGRYPGYLTVNGLGAASRDGYVMQLAPIESPGVHGQLYISFSTAGIDQSVRREAWISAAVGGSVVLGAVLVAVLISRRLAGRLVRISDAARRMASGDRSHPTVEDTSLDEVGALARAFDSMLRDLERMNTERELMETSARERLEALVAERTDALAQSREMFRLIAESTKAVPFTLDLTHGFFPYIGAHGFPEANLSEADWREHGVLDRVIPRERDPALRQRLDDCLPGPFEFLETLRVGESTRELRWTGTCEIRSGIKYLMGLMLDVTVVRQRAREASAAQKLESVGRLASGVAHEINTPVQFVSDNVRFVQTAMTDMTAIVTAYRERVATAIGEVQAVPAADDLDYLIENVPLALASSIEGLDRIATIVRSMKEFAHPDAAEKMHADLNHAIESTLVIARNEYKYVADLSTEFGELPPVQCNVGEINQVVLNLLVNAAHAIEDVVKESGQQGRLTVRTRLDGEEVEIAIEDSGAGIPESVRDKIFEPFFTTKEVGKGTGQGLALAHSIIVNKHGGSLRFVTECGKGTTFFIRLPVGERVSEFSSPQAA